MVFPDKYKFLENNVFTEGAYSIVPIRYEDRYAILKWRNEQIYHLRQSEPLTAEKQDNYFKNVVRELFDEEKPNQILFSYLKNAECIGYGGLVHINWIDKNAEISFIMDTSLEENEFSLHWETFLNLIEKVAFAELNLHKIFTYAFDLRPHLYTALENSAFVKEATLPNHCFFDNSFIDVIIHSKFAEIINIRPITIQDINFTYLLSNEPITRKNSYNTNVISYENHHNWFKGKLTDQNAIYYIGEFNHQSAAFIRIDITDNDNVIGITLSKDFRGKGLSSKYIKLVVNEFKRQFPDKAITAFIKNDNIASIKSFEKAGFKFKEDCQVLEIASKKYVI